MFEHWWRHRHIHLKEKKSVLLVYIFKDFLYQKIKSFSTAFQDTDLYIGWLLTKESCIWVVISKTPHSLGVVYFGLAGFKGCNTLLWKITSYDLRVFHNFQDKPNFGGVFKKAFPQTPCLFFLEHTTDRQMDLLF